MDAGLTYAGDVDWLYEMPAEKRVRTMAVLMARREPQAAMVAASGLRATDVVHLLAQVTAKRPKTKGDLMTSLLGQLGDG
tara:strand:- start:171 stop:410 length:240 start_codon:yes stop_codon:yes gene_type:complete